MTRALLVLAVLGALMASAHAFGLGLGNSFGKLGASPVGGAATPPPPLSNLRITNTGAFRITNTGANRAVSP